jgi:hypothetical protein
MRAPTDASPASWPMRILRPWLVATVSGLALGKLLLSVSPQNAWDEFDYLEATPRAASYDTKTESPGMDVPFSDAASLVVTLEELGGAPFSEAADINTLFPVVERDNAP